MLRNFIHSSISFLTLYVRYHTFNLSGNALFSSILNFFSNLVIAILHSQIFYKIFFLSLLFLNIFTHSISFHSFSPTKHNNISRMVTGGLSQLYSFYVVYTTSISYLCPLWDSNITWSRTGLFVLFITRRCMTISKNNKFKPRSLIVVYKTQHIVDHPTKKWSNYIGGFITFLFLFAIRHFTN